MTDDEIVPIKERTVYFLYRRGPEKYIKALYEKGEIYINIIDFIRECDENADRSDSNDGIFSRIFLGDAEIKICDVEQDMDVDGISFNTNNCVVITDSETKGNIYCLSGIYSEHMLGDRHDLEFDTKAFGESLIVIHNPKEFINRVLNAYKKQGFEGVQYRKIIYYSDAYSGNIGFFRKHEKFKHQNEFRFFIPNRSNSPIQITIGSLEDISRVENNDILRLTYTDNVVQSIKIG